MTALLFSVWYVFIFFFFSMKKKLEIQKQKQELLKKQIQEQKVTSNIPSHG